MRIGLEVGKVDALRLRRDVRGHHLPVKLGRNAKPVLPVVTRHHAVIVPALGESAAAGVEKAQAHGDPGGALQREVKPLREFTGVVAPDVELDVGRVGQAQDLDDAGIKLGGDVKLRHSV